MFAKLQILQPDGSPTIHTATAFTADGTALLMPDGPITVSVLLLRVDLSFTLTKNAPLTPVGGLAGVYQWSVQFTAADGIPPGAYALYALAYDSGGTLVGQAEINLLVGVSAPESEKKKKKKGKKAAKVK
jgi:hypothetical protein